MPLLDSATQDSANSMPGSSYTASAPAGLASSSPTGFQTATITIVATTLETSATQPGNASSDAVTITDPSPSRLDHVEARRSTGLIVGISIGALAGACVLVGFFILLFIVRRRRRAKLTRPSDPLAVNTLPATNNYFKDDMRKETLHSAEPKVASTSSKPAEADSRTAPNFIVELAGD